MFCVTNWITTPSKARNCIFFVPPAAVDATLSAGRWWGTEAHTFMSHTFNMLSLPTHIINTQREGNETSPFSSLTTSTTSSDSRERFSPLCPLSVSHPYSPLPPDFFSLMSSDTHKSCFDFPCVRLLEIFSVCEHACECVWLRR